MTGNSFIRNIRRYAALSLRTRKSYLDAVKALTMERWATASEGVTDKEQLDELAIHLASVVERNYGQNDPQFKPTIGEARSWFKVP